MEIEGKVSRMLKLVTGSGKNGEWRKQEFILETEGQYPKQVCISLWGDRIDEAGLKEGEEIKAFIDIQSREYNERWYTDVRAWKVEKKQAGAEGVDQAPPHEYIDAPAEEDDDLPF